MDWSAVAAWAEVISAVGVILSILYLAVQVRHGNRVAKASAQEALTNSFRNFTQPLAADLELYQLFDRGVEEFNKLDGADRGRFIHLAFQFGKFCESAHYYWQQGLLDDDKWSGWRSGIAHYFHAPGWQQYWAIRSELYSPTFRSFVADLPAPEKRATASGVAYPESDEIRE